MIEVSSQTIDYSPDQTIQNLIITNKSEIKILFKVRTNNIKAIDARPNTGIILPSNNVKISVKRNQNIGDNVKLQFTYLQCPEELPKQNKDIFKQLWAKNQKNQQSKTFPIRVVGGEGDKKRQDKKQISSQSDPSLFQSVRVSKSGKTQQQLSLERQKTVSQAFKKQKSKQNIQPSLIERKVEQKKTENSNLQQKKLNKNEDLIKRNLQGNKLQVEKYLTSAPCKRPHVSIGILLLVAILFFVVGYYLGYSNTPSTEI